MCSSRPPWLSEALWLCLRESTPFHAIRDPDFPGSHRSGVNPGFWTSHGEILTCITGRYCSLKLQPFLARPLRVGTAPRQPKSQQSQPSQPSQPWRVGVVAVVLCATQRGLGPGQAIFKAKASSPAKDCWKNLPGFNQCEISSKVHWIPRFHWGFFRSHFFPFNRFQDSMTVNIS